MQTQETGKDVGPELSELQGKHGVHHCLLEKCRCREQNHMGNGSLA